ncbi:lytic murein transglycosylase [Melaminivora sp.]|uniref:lytic murein transglycosylase n=1 Tax=Melaminivora sp. TaxID=1933032 RepID=UPI003917E11A
MHRSQTLLPPPLRLAAGCLALAGLNAMLGCAASAPAAPPAVPLPALQGPAAAAALPAPALLPVAAPPARTEAAAPAPASAGVRAPARAPLDAAGFRAWVEAFAPTAQGAGIGAATVHATLGQAQFLPQVLQLDRAQPEFTRPPWAYLDSALSRERVAEGRSQRRANARALDAAAARYGVPASIVTAIWGMESDYGRNFGNFRTIDALATLAYEGRRREWASRELLAAMRIVESGEIAADALIGSWAGAMGHTQFLPSVFLAHAVDADGDGRRDIWRSIPDVVASTANFLAHSGWTPGEPWGVEVRLPEGFDYARAELSVRQDSSAWAAEGVRPTGAGTLPALAGASVLAPAGARGPAVLVGSNFRALLRYNNSNSYALAVGLLARQIDGGTGLQAPWPRDLKPLSRTEVRQLQEELNARGLDVGEADGVLGPATRAGVRRLQQSLRLPADGFATRELLLKLPGR